MHDSVQKCTGFIESVIEGQDQQLENGDTLVLCGCETWKTMTVEKTTL